MGVSHLGYPRILAVDATPFSRKVNNGIVKSTLFQGWPKESLAFPQMAIPFWALLFLWSFARARGNPKRRAVSTS
jgi:hypothetical protein